MAMEFKTEIVETTTVGRSKQVAIIVFCHSEFRSARLEVKCFLERMGMRQRARGEMIETCRKIQR
jgi:hypothetical protein